MDDHDTINYIATKLLGWVPSCQTIPVPQPLSIAFALPQPELRPPHVGVSIIEATMIAMIPNCSCPQNYE
jgi:hypothetical protein